MEWFPFVRAFWPSIVSMVAGLASIFVLAPLRDSAGPFQQFFTILALVPLGLLFFGLGYGARVYYRMAQAESGVGPICTSCGGPLGVERTGRYGDYRKCLACGTNVNNRHYT